MNVVPLYLIRHGSAGVRRDDDPDDLHRHLDERGRAQATAIADWFAEQSADETPHHRIDAMFSSPAERCVQTITPLAEAMGVEIRLSSALVEGADIDDAWTLVEQAADRYRSAVLCSHGDVIPMVLRRAQMRGMIVPGLSGYKKASIWEITFADGRPESATYTPPPQLRPDNEPHRTATVRSASTSRNAEL